MSSGTGGDYWKDRALPSVFKHELLKRYLPQFGVVRCRRFNLLPRMACWRMSRSTRLRFTIKPSARSSAVIRLAPYVLPDSAWTWRIRRVSAASAAFFAARAGAVFSHR